jgi:NTE family protein
MSESAKKSTAKSKVNGRGSANGKTNGKAKKPRKHISLALQGGGSHGAFTWGCLTGCLRMRKSRLRRFRGPRPGR